MNIKNWSIKHSLTITTVLILSVAFLAVKYDNLRRELNSYKVALKEANDNIEEANSSIEDAQSYAWYTYRDMGEALEDLMTVDTVKIKKF